MLNKLHESLFILYKCSSTIERLHKAFEEHREKGPMFSFHHYSHNFIYYIIMESVAFLDEYDKFFVEKKVEGLYKERIAAVRKVAAPLRKRIGRWAGLRYYRDTIVAHGWRDKKNGYILIVPHKKFFDVPKSLFELQFLKDLIKSLYNLIEEEFKGEANYAIYYGYGGEKEEGSAKDYSSVNDDLQKMLDEMNSIRKSLGKDYDIKITGYRFPSDNE